MVHQRQTSLRALWLTLVMGLAVSWPSLVHFRLHGAAAHAHDHSEAASASSDAPLQFGSADDADEHPHLELTATRPAESGLHLVFLVSNEVSLQLPEPAPGHNDISVFAATGSRSPPGTPPPPIRAPPTLIAAA
jgi:hypothetical protein